MKALLALVCCQLLAASVSAIIFDIRFVDAGSAQEIGTGQVTLFSDPGTGEFLLSSLNPSLDFTFPAYGTYTEADIVHSANVLLSEAGGVRRLQFSGNGGPNLGGSFELYNGSFYLSFEPSSFGGGLELFVVADPALNPVRFGRYIATTSVSVPEGGATASLMAMALLFCGLTGGFARPGAVA